MLFSRVAKKYQISELWDKAENTYDLHAVDANRFAIIPGPIPHGAFVVTPGDKWLGTSGERSEIVVGGWRNVDFIVTGAEAGTETYALSMYLAAPWEPPDVNEFGYKWGIFLQLHSPNSFALSPAFALGADEAYTLYLIGGDIESPVAGYVPLVHSELVFDKFVSIVFQVKWSPVSDGFVVIYRRNEGELDYVLMGGVYNVPTLQWSGVAANYPHYWKYGYYRSESDHTNSVVLGPLVRQSGRCFV